MDANFRYEFLKNEVLTAENHTIYKWVCAYQQETGLNKVLRHTRPTKVLIKADQEYLDAMKRVKSEPKDWKIRHSLSYIDPFIIYGLNKKGEALKKEVKFWSNFHGDKGLFCYDTEDECNKKYNDLIWENLKSLKDEKIRVMEDFDQQIKHTQSLFVGGTDIVLEILSRDK